MRPRVNVTTRLRDLLRPFRVRLAVLTGAVVLVSTVGLGLAVYATVRLQLEAQLRARLSQETAEILKGVYPADARSLVEAVQARAEEEELRGIGIRLSAPDGTFMAGDRWLPVGTPGFGVLQDLTRAAANTAGAGDAIALTTALPDGSRLTLATDMSWVEEMERTLLSEAAITLLLGLLLALAGGLLVSQFVSQRIEAVTRTARSIMDGDLKSRVSLNQTDDDFDRLAATVNAMLDRISTLLENLKQISGDIAHDLRTPLAHLRQNLDVARRAADASGYEAAIDRAIAGADNVLAMFSAVLRITQIEGAASRAGFRRIDLSEIMRSVAEAYAPSAEEGSRGLITLIEPAVLIDGDLDLLIQLFANLVENALQHTPPGTTVRLELQGMSDHAVARVSDDGPGVPEEERDKIFQRFYRLERSRTTPGHGLGLALVGAIAELHHASIAVTDNKPGLVITVSFPTRSPEQLRSLRDDESSRQDQIGSTPSLRQNHKHWRGDDCRAITGGK